MHCLENLKRMYGNSGLIAEGINSVIENLNANDKLKVADMKKIKRNH